MEESDLSFLFKHQGKEYSVSTDGAETFLDLKRKIEEQTDVQPKRQKVLGVKTLKGGIPKDEDLLSECTLKKGQRYSVMGQSEAVILACDTALAFTEAPEVFNDLGDLKTAMKEMRFTQAHLEEGLQRREGKCNIRQLNPPRPNRKCLVLDIDYTFFDMSSSAERPSQLLRPHLHELLESVYEYYDIVVWSATSMRWIEIKLRELGLTTNPNYKVSVLMDGTCMIPVTDPSSGNVFTCKPLAMLWRKYPDTYKPENTIMADDLVRNFVFNTANGLQAPPYKHCHQNFATDTFLLYLKFYLLLVRNKADFQKLDLRPSAIRKYVAKYVLPAELRRCTHPRESGQG